MRKLIIATNNQHKVDEIRAFLASHTDLQVLSLKEAGIAIDPEENAPDFAGNALIKARAVAEHCGDGAICIADDSGLEVDFLGGAPGVHSARFAGLPADDVRNNQKLLTLLAGVPEEKRTARFVSVICVVFPDGRTEFYRGECEGTILTEPRGAQIFGYDPLFYYAPMKQSFAEMDLSIKNTVSHRARALEQLSALLTKPSKI